MSPEDTPNMFPTSVPPFVPVKKCTLNCFTPLLADGASSPNTHKVLMQLLHGYCLFEVIPTFHYKIRVGLLNKCCHYTSIYYGIFYSLDCCVFLAWSPKNRNRVILHITSSPNKRAVSQDNSHVLYHNYLLATGAEKVA